MRGQLLPSCCSSAAVIDADDADAAAADDDDDDDDVGNVEAEMLVVDPGMMFSIRSWFLSFFVPRVEFF